MKRIRRRDMRPVRYGLDLSGVSLPAYGILLRGRNLLPSRRLLLQGLEENFARMQTLGIRTVADLLKTLSTPAKVAGCAAKSGVPAEYLTVLRREAGTLVVKPVPLAAFPGTDTARIEALLARGIKNSKDYFEAAQDREDELFCLCDLARINGVGPNAAKMFYDAGYRSPAVIAAVDAETLLSHIAQANAAHRFYQGTLGHSDAQFCIDMAGLLIRLQR
jgi:hypothetical protein